MIEHCIVFPGHFGNKSSSTLPGFCKTADVFWSLYKEFAGILRSLFQPYPFSPMFFQLQPFALCPKMSQHMWQVQKSRNKQVQMIFDKGFGIHHVGSLSTPALKGCCGVESADFSVPWVPTGFKLKWHGTNLRTSPSSGWMHFEFLFSRTFSYLFHDIFQKDIILSYIEIIFCCLLQDCKHERLCWSFRWMEQLPCHPMRTLLSQHPVGWHVAVRPHTHGKDVPCWSSARFVLHRWETWWMHGDGEMKELGRQTETPIITAV